MVLASSVIVTAITLGGLALNRAQRDAYQAQQDLRRARMAAASGLEASTRILSPTIEGRQAMSDPVHLPSEIDGVQLTYDIFDTIDASLTNDMSQPIAVTVEARFGSARQMITGSMSPRLTPVGMAKYGVAATAGIKLTSTSVDVAAGVYSGTGVDAIGANVSAPVYSVGSMTGATYHGTRTTVTAASAFDGDDLAELLAAATPISYNTLPGGKIENVVLSPSINPFGAATNARGIYLIDCDRQRLRIRNARIVGTLIVLNAKADSFWEGGLNATAHDARLPAIVWLGGLTVSTSGSDLVESVLGVSLNPPGAPYLGQSDADTLDQFPSLVTGSMVVIGDLDIDGTLSVDGRVLVVGSIIASGATIRVREDPDGVVPDCLKQADGFEFIAGSVAREVDQP
jgi:hypothetical protein